MHNAGYLAATRSLRATFAAGGLALAIAGCGVKEPFQYFPVQGTIAYDDGTLLPVTHLVLSFHPQEEPRDARTSPRRASALVDSKTGRFSSVTSHKPSDGLMACKYKVTLHQPSRIPLPAGCADEAYGDPTLTPLEIQGGKSSIDLRVAKPAK